MAEELMTDELAWRFPVVVAELPEGGREFDLKPDEAARASLARFAGVLAVPALTARLHVRPVGRDGAVVGGTIEGAVRQMCGVTLEPFDNPISESVSLRFAPPAAGANKPNDEVDVDLAEDDPPDPLVNGAVDLAVVVAEFLALAIDPYPRKPGAVFSPPAEQGGQESSPFAALEKLKAGKKGEND